jgi:hypothetical protein
MPSPASAAAACGACGTSPTTLVCASCLKTPPCSPACARAGVAEELEALHAIYGADFSARSVDDGTVVEVALSSGVIVRLCLSHHYPRDAPALELDGLSRGARARAQRAAQAIADVRGEEDGAPILFDLVEAVRGAVDDADDGAGEPAPPPPPPPLLLPPPPPPPLPASLRLAHGAASTVGRSRFLGWAARVHSAADVAAVLAAVRASPLTARASHVAIHAFAYTDGSTGRRHADCDDDGEAAAGRNLAHLLAVLGAENVLVAVTRWFGGVLLGPQRFRVITECARDVLSQQAWFSRA